MDVHDQVQLEEVIQVQTTDNHVGAEVSSMERTADSEATGPGAAGTLTGPKEAPRQQQ